MNDQLLDSLASGSGNGTNQVATALQAQLAGLFWLGLVGTVIVTVLLVIYAIYKMRVQAAILRIDKNLQKLIDAQTPFDMEKVVEQKTPKKSAEHDIEQK